jgi:hypothetical protein
MLPLLGGDARSPALGLGAGHLLASCMKALLERLSATFWVRKAPMTESMTELFQSEVRRRSPSTPLGVTGSRSGGLAGLSKAASGRQLR